MKALDHAHIVRYVGTQRSPPEENPGGVGYLYIFLEYVPGGSVASMYQQFGPFNEDLVRHYTRQILLGVEYLFVDQTLLRPLVSEEE